MRRKLVTAEKRCGSCGEPLNMVVNFNSSGDLLYCINENCPRWRQPQMFKSRIQEEALRRIQDAMDRQEAGGGPSQNPAN